MTTSLRLLPVVLFAACIPAMPGSWSGSPPPLPPPPPPAQSAFDDEPVARSDEREDNEAPARTTEWRTESHQINGREMRGGGGGGGSGGTSHNDDFPQPTARQLKELKRAIDDLPQGERIKKFSGLIDPFYLTVEQLAELVEEVPSFDRVRAITVAACSVVDPENASRITRAVVYSDRSKALGALQTQCFRKNNWDKRPPGRMGHRAAPPPGAYLLPSER